MPNDAINNEGVAQEEIEQSQPQQQEEVGAETIESINFRKMREDRERDREARIRAEYEVEKMREYISNLNAQQSKKEEEDTEIDDDYVDYKDFKEVKKKQEEQSRRYEQALSNQERQLAQMQLLSEFKDYHNIVTEENINMLEKRHPEVAPAILNATSEYNCGKAAYLFIKKFLKEDRELAHTNNTAQKNLAKPMPAVSVSPQESNSPLNEVNNYVKDYTNIDFNDEYWTNLRKEKETAIRKKN